MKPRVLLYILLNLYLLQCEQNKNSEPAGIQTVSKSSRKEQDHHLALTLRPLAQGDAMLDWLEEMLAAPCWAGPCFNCQAGREMRRAKR